MELSGSYDRGCFDTYVFAKKELDKRAAALRARAETYDCRKPDEEEAQYAYNEAAKEIEWGIERVRQFVYGELSRGTE